MHPMIPFRITGLAPERFAHLYGLSDADLARHGALRYVVDATPGFPDRIEMRDLEIGERALLLNFTHLDAPSPYRSSHAIFVREGATERYDRINTIPEIMRVRPLSLRAYDADHMMLGAELVNGLGIETVIERFLADQRVAYVHAHNAKPGCYSGRIDRV